MNKEQIIATVRSLAKSKGFYGRLLIEFDLRPEMLDELEKQNFKDELDLILYLET